MCSGIILIFNDNVIILNSIDSFVNSWDLFVFLFFFLNAWTLTFNDRKVTSRDSVSEAKIQ